MDNALVSLIAASLTLVGTHFALSHPLRAPLVKVLGEGGFAIAYSLISLGAVVWMYFAFKAAPATTPLWTGFDDISWTIGSLIALIAMVFYAGAMTPKNPSLPMPGASEAARAEPQGLFKVTRHPMMWGFALWAISHMVAAPTARTLVVASAVLFLALIGAKMLDRKKRMQMGDAWATFESRTSYWPRWSALFSVGWMPWAIGLAIWLVMSWLHLPAGDIPAGIFRWV
jgi:uncharacterized membrane protein